MRPGSSQSPIPPSENASQQDLIAYALKQKFKHVRQHREEYLQHDNPNVSPGADWDLVDNDNKPFTVSEKTVNNFSSDKE